MHSPMMSGSWKWKMRPAIEEETEEDSEFVPNTDKEASMARDRAGESIGDVDEHDDENEENDVCRGSKDKLQR